MENQAKQKPLEGILEEHPGRVGDSGKPPRDHIEELVGALTDPLIVFPAGGWEYDLPQYLRDRLPLDRLAHQMRCLRGEASWEETTDLEALLYLYPASLVAPMGEQWTRIYLYLGTRCLGDKLPGEVRQESLDDYDMGELRQLKRWIRKQQVKARKAKAGKDQGESRASQVMPVKIDQPRMF